MKRQRILVADDHLIVRQGFRALLEQAGHIVVAEAANGREAIQLACTVPVDIVILDLIMPVLNGVDAARELAKSKPKIRTILLTMHSDRPYVIEALEAGAKGYVLKTQASDDLVHAIHEVSRGAIYISPTATTSLVDAFLGRERVPVPDLTARELQTLQLIAESKSTKEIARLLDISYKTADSHRARLMKKLDIHETAGLVRFAVKRGLVHL